MLWFVSVVFILFFCFCFFFQAEDGIRDWSVTGVQTCALPIYVKQIERVVAAEAPRSTAARGLAEPPHAAAAATFVRRPASLSSAPSASPSTEPPRQSEARVTPETTSPGVPPAPVIALPSPPTSRDERPGPPSPPRPEPDLKTKIREDWETTTRDARNAGNEIKAAVRRLRDWISP